MELITANLAGPNDEMLDWAFKGTDNFFDPSVLTYPATSMLLAKSPTKRLVYMPVQTAFVLESLAINPEATSHEVAVALRELIVALTLAGQQKGIGELYFMGTNERTNTFAEKHGLEELPWKIFRHKILPGVIYENIPKPNSGSADIPAAS